MKQMTCRPYEMSKDLARQFEVEKRTSSSMSLRRALNFSSNCPRIPEPAMMADRSIDRTRLLWRDLFGRFLENAE